MSGRRVAVSLGAAITLQLLILAGMVLWSAVPLWTGTEIRVRTVPVDPRSMFRGNYVRLRYEFGTLPAGALGPGKRLRAGEVVYVSLKEAKGGGYGFAGASLEPPSEGLFLRGRLTGNSEPLRVKYGIEAFFAPRAKAMRLERDLSNGGVAVLMVTAAGRAALRDVIANPNPAPGPGPGRGPG